MRLSTRFIKAAPDRRDFDRHAPAPYLGLSYLKRMSFQPCGPFSPAGKNASVKQ